jgi:hypothetical protein
MFMIFFLPIVMAAVGVASAVSGFLGQSSAKQRARKLQEEQVVQAKLEAKALEADKKFASQQVMLDFTKAKEQAQLQQWQTIYSANFKEEQANLAAAQAAATNRASLFQVEQQAIQASADTEAAKQQTFDALSDEQNKAQSAQTELQGASDQASVVAAITGQNSSQASAQAAERGQLQTEAVGQDNRNYSREVADELQVQSQYNDRVAALQKELGISAVDAQAKLDEMGLGYAQMVSSYSKTNARTQKKQEINSAKALKNAALFNVNASTDLNLSRNALQQAQIKGQGTGTTDPFSVLGAAGNLYGQLANTLNPVQQPIQVGSVNLGSALNGRNAGMFNQAQTGLNTNRQVSTYTPGANSTIYNMPPISSYPSNISTYPSTVSAPPPVLPTTRINTLPPSR